MNETRTSIAEVRAIAYAKLTLSLRVIGRRDDGFHDIDALVVSIGQPHDVLDISPSSISGVRIEVDVENLLLDPEVAAHGVDLHGEGNLAVRAAELLLERHGGTNPIGVDLKLRKRIPVGAGLGGGSADAAGALLGVRAALELTVTMDSLMEIAASLGSDVPFCLRGGSAQMGGRGELLIPAVVPRGTTVLVVVPPFAVSTPEVYAAWDSLGGPHGESDALFVNDLEPAAIAVEPRLEDFRDEMAVTVGSKPVMAGSGSAYWIPVADSEKLLELAESVRGAMPDASVFAAGTVPRGVRLRSS